MAESRSPSPSKTEDQAGALAEMKAIEKCSGGDFESMKRKEFMRKWSISDGFDVGVPPNPLGLKGGFLVMHEYYINRLGIDACFKCVRFVIKSENNKNSNLELVEIVKYNVELELTGKMLFLTFKAKDEEGREDVYQAKVFSPETDGEEGDEMKVVIFRKKPSEYQQSKGAEQGKEKGGCSCNGGSNSDGFDAGDHRRLGLVGAPTAIRELKIKSWRIDACFKCLDFAIKSENNDKNSNLEFVQLVKYNMQYESRGETYSITFKAKEKEGREDVYQAKVFNPKKDGEEGYEMKVVIFRKKPSEYQQISKDVEEKHGRGKKKEGCSCDGGSNVSS